MAKRHSTITCTLSGLRACPLDKVPEREICQGSHWTVKPRLMLFNTIQVGFPEQRHEKSKETSFEESTSSYRQLNGSYKRQSYTNL